MNIDKIIQLNQEHKEASEERKREIEQELITLIPKEFYTGEDKLVALAASQSALRFKIEKMKQKISSSEVKAYAEEVSKLNEKILTYAKELEDSTPTTTLGNSIKEFLRRKFKGEDK